MTWDQISIVIRHVAGKREAELAALSAQLAPVVPIIAEHGKGRPYYLTLADALRLGAKACKPWILHVEDDAFLGKTFAVDVPRLLTGQAGPVSFYHARPARKGEDIPAQALLESFPGHLFSGLVCTAFPLALVEPLCQHIDRSRSGPQQIRGGCCPLVADFLRSKNLTFARAWPSLVQHRPVPSLLGTARIRSAPSFTDPVPALPASPPGPAATPTLAPGPAAASTPAVAVAPAPAPTA